MILKPAQRTIMQEQMHFLGVNGPDEDVSSSMRAIDFLEDESVGVDITYSGNLSSNPVYVVLDFVGHLMTEVLS